MSQTLMSRLGRWWVAGEPHPRPGDILNAVRAVESYSAAPKMLCWQAALHIVVYIKSTNNLRYHVLAGSR